MEEKVHDLYDAKDPERADWADWLAKEHVFVVADNATLLANRFGANPEYARAAASLHDIADAKMKRFDERHEETSINISCDASSRVRMRAANIAKSSMMKRYLLKIRSIPPTFINGLLLKRAIIRELLLANRQHRSITTTARL